MGTGQRPGLTLLRRPCEVLLRRCCGRKFVAIAQLGFGEFGPWREIDVEEIDLLQRGPQPPEPMCGGAGVALRQMQVAERKQPPQFG